MKKKNKPEQPREFEHTPFKSLKGYKPADTPARHATRKPPAAAKDPGENDTELFLRAVSGVRELHDEGPEAHVPQKSSRPEAGTDRQEEQVFLQAMQKIGGTLRPTAPPEEPEDDQRRSSSSRMKQLRRGTIRISEELDLHGHQRDEALRRLASFIRAAYSRGRKAVLVITGKGINSPEGPVLQGAVAEWLRQGGKAMVAEWAPAPRDKGGSGAVVVFLKNPGPKREDDKR